MHDILADETAGFLTVLSMHLCCFSYRGMLHEHVVVLCHCRVDTCTETPITNGMMRVQVFFKEHDPTLSNGKAQYKSAIWYHTDKQKEVAEQMIEQISSQSNKPVATDLASASQWTDAEDYHQNYYHKSGM